MQKDGGWWMLKFVFVMKEIRMLCGNTIGIGADVCVYFSSRLRGREKKHGREKGGKR